MTPAQSQYPYGFQALTASHGVQVVGDSNPLAPTKEFRDGPAFELAFFISAADRVARAMKRQRAAATGCRNTVFNLSGAAFLLSPM